MDAPSPIKGIRVLDLTQAMAGPIATMLLGDLGAEIIKIESPKGDQTRNWAPPFINDVSAYFLSVNRNKKSISIDLKTSEGQELLRELIKNSDVLIENFRPGTMKRLGADYETARELNPKLIYCSMSGYGQTGPQKDWPGYDLTVLASSGLLSLNGEEGRTPIKFGVPIADITAGLFSDIAVLSALYERRGSGLGQFIDMSMLDANFMILTHQAFSYFATGENPKKLGSAHPSIAPYQVFKSSDSYIAIAVGTEKLWNEFCKCIKREDLLANKLYTTNRERVQNRDTLVEDISTTLSRMTSDEIFTTLKAAGIPVAPINSVSEAVTNDHIRERDMVTEIEAPYGRIPMLGTPFKLSRTPGKITSAPPLLGENTDEILENLGISKEKVKDYRTRGIIH